MAGYANLTEVYRQLGLDPASVDPIEVAKRTHVQSLDDTLATAFEGKVDRSWRGSITPTERAIKAYCSDLLVLPVPVVSVTQVVTGGVWNGTTFAGGSVRPASEYYLPIEYTNNEGQAYAIQSTVAPWDGVVLVTAVWADADLIANVPDDVVQAMTELVIGTYHRETYNARDTQQGFDEVDPLPAPNPWNLPSVKAAIERYTHKVMVV